MERDNKKRPNERGKTTVMKERPQTPASRPKDPRPRSGNAAAREAARKERMAAKEGRDVKTREPREEKTREAREPKTREARENRAVREVRKPAREPEQKAPKEEEPKKAKRSRKKKPHRVYNTNFGFKFAVMLAVVAAIVLSMIIFFKVKHVEVVLPTDEAGQSASYYTAQEIIDASGINLDENLLSLSKATAASRIHAALPYVNEIQIKKQLPGTVIISFTEFEVTYAIQDVNGGWWLMSREGRILEAADEQSIHGHMQVTGMPIQVPAVGDYFKPAATEGADMSEIANKQKVVLEAIPALEQTPFAKEIVSLDVSASYDLKLWYGTRYEIRLGTTNRLDYKLNFLQETLNNTDVQRRSGTIDLTFNEDDKVHFLEFR